MSLNPTGKNAIALAKKDRMNRFILVAMLSAQPPTANGTRGVLNLSGTILWVLRGFEQSQAGDLRLRVLVAGSK